MWSERPSTDWMRASSWRPTAAMASAFADAGGAASNCWCEPSAFNRYRALCRRFSRERAASSHCGVMRMAGSTSAHRPQKIHLPKSSVAVRMAFGEADSSRHSICLLYTSDAADEEDSVDV